MKEIKDSKEVNALFKAVEAYVKKHNGSVIVIGDISIIRMPENNKFTYNVAIKCTGKLPEVKK